MHLQNHGSLASSGIRKEKNKLGHPKREGCTSARFTGLILKGTTSNEVFARESAENIPPERS